MRENFGDPVGAPWDFDPAVDAHAFRLLGFAETSAGISRTQRENRDGWYEHARRHKAFILDAVARVENPRLAVVLGAGKAYDLPLEELANRFERVMLVDIDAEAMAASSAAAVRDAKLRARLELRPMDVTGITRHIALGIEQAFDSIGQKRSWRPCASRIGWPRGLGLSMNARTCWSREWC